MKTTYLNYLSNLDKIKNITNTITQNSNVIVQNAAGNLAKVLTINLFRNTKKTIVAVYPNIYEATIAYEDYLELMENEAEYDFLTSQVSFFPVEELVASEFIASSNTYRL